MSDNLSLSLSLSRKRGVKVLATALTTLALLIGGGFLISQNQPNANAVATTVFTDNFNGGTLDVSWVNRAGNSSTWTINNGQLVSTPGDVTFNTVNGVMVNADYAIQNGSVKADIIKSTSGGANAYYAMLAARFNTTTESGYTAFIQEDGNYNWFGFYKIVNGSNTTLTQSLCNSYKNLAEGESVRAEFSVQSTSPTDSELVFTIYNAAGDTQLCQTSVTNSEPALQGVGYWGFATYKETIYDNAEIISDDSQPNPSELTLALLPRNVEYGNSVTLRVLHDQTETVTLADDTGGVFSADSVNLDNANNYTADVTYTPSQVGYNTVTISNGDDEISEQVFVSPYSTTIGFIGDSITQGTISGVVPGAPAVTVAGETLGSGFDFVNSGSGGSDTNMWANNSDGNNKLTNAINSFKTKGVDVVSIMLGTNDAVTAGPNISVEDYKSNMQTIIDALKTNGMRLVILNAPIYSAMANRSDTLIVGYGAALAELANENEGFVLLGDTQAYDYFKENPTLLGDNLHPNAEGHEVLGGLWADAIRADLEYEINPDKTWASSDNEFTLGEDGSLTLSIDKYIDEFAGVVKVDGVALTDSVDYTATAGSTVIELLNSYLRDLNAGTYTLTVAFNGGVTTSSQFTILAANTGGNNGGNTGGNTGGSTNPSTPFSPNVPNTGSNLGKLVSENKGAVLAGLAVIIAGLGISIVLVTRKLTKM